MQRSKVDKYRVYLQSLMDFMSKRIKIKPYPKIKLNTKVQKDDVFGKTAYYDPEEKTVVIFVASRFFKDAMRSAAHELIHHSQNLEGRLAKGSYNGENIIKDGKLMELEKEAYLKGNILFRSWTESVQNGEIPEPTEKTRKMVKLDTEKE